jgi:NAD-dependent SIR2 family protein deacetylase
MFYHFIAGLKKASSQATVTRTHEWFNELGKQGSLLRLYTQNIDDLDKRSGYV